MLSLSNDDNNIFTKATVTHISIPYSLVSDFLYQHRVAFDGAVSEVEILDTSNCAVSNESGKMLLLALKLKYHSLLTKGSTSSIR